MHRDTGSRLVTNLCVIQEPQAMAQLQGTILYRDVSECEYRLSDTYIRNWHPTFDHPK